MKEIICIFCMRSIETNDDEPISYGVCEECKDKLKQAGFEAHIVEGK